MIKFIKNREWDIFDFQSSRIENAIFNASKAVWKNTEDDIKKIKIITEKVVYNLWKNSIEWVLSIEKIQDVVEKTLIEENQYELAKEYIIYRNKKNEERKWSHEKVLKKLEKEKLTIIKHDWRKEHFSMAKIKKTYDFVAKELEKNCPFSFIEEKMKSYIVDWVKSEDITKLIIKSAIDLISVDNTKWQNIAWRFATLDLYKKATRNRKIENWQVYSWKNFKDLFDTYIDKWLYYKDFYKHYSEEDIFRAWEYLDQNRDFEYNYSTVLMYWKRYLLNPNKHVMELPQEMYMAAALFLAIPEKKNMRLKTAIQIYEYCSSQKISLPTPTLMNARTNYQQLSSCFVLNLDDDLRSIYHNVENMAQISKFGWWVWSYLWHIRSQWWYIRWNKWAAWWVAPWIKVINDTAIAVNQLWTRKWSISVTLDIWHRDMEEFLDLQTETWDIRRKSFDVFPAVSIPDLFMKRVEENWNWTLFDPKEIKDLTWKRLEDFFWDEFEKFYVECENNKKLELKKSIPAKEIFKTYLKSVVETWMPYAFFRDTVNRLNPNKHAWNVYSTQLCTEICQNTSPAEFIEETHEDWIVSVKYKPWDTVVCNLASINVAKVNKDKEIKKIIPIAMKILDNVIDLNFYPVKETELTAKKYRSVWLWFMWLAEHLACNKMQYDSQEAREYTDDLFERYAYFTMKSSVELAKERWAYELFEWSERSKWIILWKDKKYFEANSKISDKWSKLIDEMQEHWTRFAYHTAPAPNTSTAWVVWTTAWLLPIYRKYFVETNMVAPSVVVAPNLNKDNFWYYKEYVNMNMNDVIDMMSWIYKWIDQSVSFEWIINPMNVSPVEIYNYYFKTRRTWIKTIYYVRSMSLDVDECVSCSW